MDDWEARARRDRFHRPRRPAVAATDAGRWAGRPVPTLRPLVGPMTTTRSTRGGVRPGAGRKSAYPGKSRSFAMDFTPAGRKVLKSLVARHRLSRNDLLAHLSLRYADRLTFDAPGVVFPGKLAANVLTIRVPADAGDKLTAVHRRTLKSYSDIGEALVCWYGPTEKDFPPSHAARRRARRRR